MKHAFSSGKSDGADSTLINPSNWNDVHIFSIANISVNTTLTSANDIAVVTCGTSTITITLPAANAKGGLPIYIKRPASDNGTGIVDIAAAGTDTIEGSTAHWKLINGGQCVTFVADGTSNWHVVGGY